MKITFSKFLMKLTAYGCLMGTVPIVILGLFAYFHSSSALQDKVNKANMLMLSQTFAIMERELQYIDQLANQLTISSPVLNAMGKDVTGQDLDTASRLQESLGILQSGLRIEESTIVSLKHHWVVGNGSAFGFYQSLTDAKEKFAALLKDPRASYWYLDQTRNALAADTPDAQQASPTTIRLVKKLPLYSDDPVGLLIVSIPVQEIKQRLFAETEFNNLLIMQADGRLLTSMDQIPAAMLTLMYERVKQTTTSQGILKLDHKEQTYNVTFRKSSYNGWIYLSITSVRDATKESKSIGWVTILVSLAVIVLAIIVALFGSREIYRPVQKLYRSAFQAGERNASLRTLDEIELIDERLRNLMHNGNAMSIQIEIQARQLQPFFVLQLFQGELSNAEIAEKWAYFGYRADWRRYVVLVLQIDTLEGTRYEEQDRDLLMFALNNMVSEIVSDSDRIIPILIGQSQVTLLGYVTEDEEHIKQSSNLVAEAIQAKVAEFLNLKVSLGISAPFQVIHHAKKGFKEGLEALKYRVHFGNEVILNIDEVRPPMEAGRTRAFPGHLLSELLDAIKLQDRDEVQSKLKAFFQEVFDDRRDVKEYELTLNRLLSEFVRLYQDIGGEVKSLVAPGPSLFEQLSGLNNLNEIESWFTGKVIDPLMTLYKEQREILYTKISNEILNIIHSEYESDLTLEECAARLNYSTAYLSRLFRKETGLNFSDYLAKYRLSMSKKWLVETEMTVSDISARLRYTNSQNFIRYFKKMEGITPGKYRERHQA